MREGAPQVAKTQKRRAPVWYAPLKNYTQVLDNREENLNPISLNLTTALLRHYVICYLPALPEFFIYLKKSEFGSRTSTSFLLLKLFS